MPYYSEMSNQRLNQCHNLIVKIFNEVIKYYDCKIICGHRTAEAQKEAFESGHSKLKYPDSKHNQLPSLAIDVAPYPVDWYDTDRFYHFAGFVEAVAIPLLAGSGYRLRWGGDWDSDREFNDQTFLDLAHYELEEI